MPTQYPTTLDTATQQPAPSASTEMDDSGYEHDILHTSHSGALLALEAKLGVGATTAAGASTNHVLVKQGDGDTEWAAAPASVPTTITVADTTDTTCFVGVFEAASGDLPPKTDAALIYNAGTGSLEATVFTGPLTGLASSASTAAACTGNSATVTVDDTTNTTCSVALFESTSGSLAAKTDGALDYNAATGSLQATVFTGDLAGDVTGDVTGTIQTAAQGNITSVGTMTGLAVNGTSQLYECVITDIPGNLTPALGDAGKVFFCSQSGGTQTITIDGSITWPLGTQMVFVAQDTATVTFAESNSTDITSKDDNMSIDGRYASAALIHWSTAGSGKWFLIGALA